MTGGRAVPQDSSLQAFRIVLQNSCRRILRAGIAPMALIVSRDITLAVPHVIGAKTVACPRLVDRRRVHADRRVRQPSLPALPAGCENRDDFHREPGGGRAADETGLLAKRRLRRPMA